MRALLRNPVLSLVISFMLVVSPCAQAGTSKLQRCLSVFGLQPVVLALSLFPFQTSAGERVLAQADQIPTATEKVIDAQTFKPLPGFTTEQIVFVRDGVEVEDLMNLYLAPETTEAIEQGGLHWLAVKDVRVDTRDIQRTPTGYRMRVVASQRYVKVKDAIEGTANIVFDVKLNPLAAKRSERAQVTLTTFDDQESTEAAGRKRWGINFDKFLDSIAGNVLRTHFLDAAAVDQLVSLAQQYRPGP